jgi:mannitol/fructose-specific phosphotransferase system IIA component (Ntr-type)
MDEDFRAQLTRETEAQSIYAFLKGKLEMEP